MRPNWVSFAIILLLAVPPAARPNSVTLLPPSGPVFVEAGTTSLLLVMDFDGEPTVGGGLDFSLTGPIAIAGFVPSAWFLTEPDPAFTGFGSQFADGDFEIHFGSFFGLSGSQVLGELVLTLLDVGEAGIAMAINTRFEGFTSISAAQMTVALNGTALTVTNVPAPGAGWLLLTGGIWLWTRARRGRTRAA